MKSIMDGNEAGWEEATGVDGVARIFGYVPAALPPKDFFLSAGQSKAEAFAAIVRSTWRGIGLILAGFFGEICVAWAGGRKFARWPGPDSRKGTDEWRIGCNDARTSSVARPVNAVQSSSDETQIPIAEPLKVGIRRAGDEKADWGFFALARCVNKVRGRTRPASEKNPSIISA
jgi:hypothetical protein